MSPGPEDIEGEIDAAIEESVVNAEIEAAITDAQTTDDPRQWENVDPMDLREGDRVRVTVDDEAARHFGKQKLVGTVMHSTSQTGNIVFDFFEADGVNRWVRDGNRLKVAGGAGTETIGSVVNVERQAPMGEPRVEMSHSFGDRDLYAVWDWETRGFARQGMFGQVVFETVAEARELSGDNRDIVKLVPVEDGADAKVVDSEPEPGDSALTEPQPRAYAQVSDALDGVESVEDLHPAAQRVVDHIDMSHLRDRLEGQDGGLRPSKPQASGDTGLTQYVWRMARFNSGKDPEMPVTAAWWLQDWLDEQGIDAEVSGILDEPGKQITAILDVVSQMIVASFGQDPGAGAERWEGVLFGGEE